MWQGKIEKIGDCKFRIPKSYKQGMRVDGIIYADESLMSDIIRDKACEQVANVAFLPGIVNNSIAMPDIHWGYGFPIGGVAVTDPDQGGVISPGGVGFDINCGVRILKTSLTLQDVKNKLESIVNQFYQNIPAGVGSKGQIRVSPKEQRKLVCKGARWAVEKGMGIEDDLIYCEENGEIEGADPDSISDRAYERGKSQPGTLGSGNHFIEVEVVDEIFDNNAAQVIGIFNKQILISIHSGSRGFGYQVCDDYSRRMLKCLDKYGINVPDRQLSCAPLKSNEAKEYIGAMRAAANYAWCNRQILMHLTRESFEKVFLKSWQTLGMYLIYDVAHNIAKFETHKVEGKEKKLCVHRKGATRSFGPNNPQIPQKYRSIGQPVIIPGDMGRGSYLLVGTKKCEEEAFGTTCHGAGRLKSRHQALKTIDLNLLLKELDSKGVKIRAANKKTIVEEAPSVYKNVDDVVSVVDRLGFSRKVCKMKPLAVLKG